MAMTRLLTLNEISRRLDVPYQWLEAMVRNRQLLPNAICGHSFLFDAERLNEIARRIRLGRAERRRNAQAVPIG